MTIPFLKHVKDVIYLPQASLQYKSGGECLVIDNCEVQ